MIRGEFLETNPSGAWAETEHKMRMGNAAVGLCIKRDRLPKGSPPKHGRFNPLWTGINIARDLEGDIPIHKPHSTRTHT